MKLFRKLGYGFFDFSETVLGALVFSVSFPLYITEHIDVKVFSFLYGASFFLSFLVALALGRFADERSLRKPFFGFFGLSTSFVCSLIGLSLSLPTLALGLFLILALLHQQTMVFYNSLLMGFEERGFTSGLGVALGYVGSAMALLLFADALEGAQVYLFSGTVLFLGTLITSLAVENPKDRGRVDLKLLFKDRTFLVLLLSILTVTEVANTMVAMMGVYLREVYNLGKEEIYRIIGLSALGGVAGGVLWGWMSDRFSAGRIFPLGFALWASFLVALPVVPRDLLLPLGFVAGLSLSHLWTVGRLLILEKFPLSQASTRFAFLSLTERIASTTGLTLWSFLLFVTSDNMKLSALLMAFLPLCGAVLYRWANSRARSG